MRVLGLVLAGGRATRMGGVDKGLQLFDGGPLALRAVKRLSPQVDSVVLSANRSFEAYKTILPEGVSVLPDVRPGFPGPLAGLEAALSSVPEEDRESTWVVTVPCDCPFFPEDLVQRLSAGIVEGAVAAVASTVGKLQPSFFLVRADQLSSLKAYLDADGHRLRAWLESIGAVPVAFEDERAFLNCNTLEELRQAQLKA